MGPSFWALPTCEYRVPPISMSFSQQLGRFYSQQEPTQHQKVKGVGWVLPPTPKQCILGVILEAV